jgi:hypothetical protein
MGFISLLLGAIKSIGDVFQELVSWFKKTTQQKVDDGKKQIEKEEDKAKKDGRPTWGE